MYNQNPWLDDHDPFKDDGPEAKGGCLVPALVSFLTALIANLVLRALSGM